MNQKSVINEVAAKIGVNPDWLENLIRFESGFNPQAQNPNSSARGLIQFLDATAQSLHFRDSLDLVMQYPDFESQMRGPVADYLKKYGPFNTEQSLYMSVFYPAYRSMPLDTEFPRNVQAANPGIRTVRDYINKVRAKSGLPALAGEGLAALAVGALIYFIVKNL